jgi:hypothetical protein
MMRRNEANFRLAVNKALAGLYRSGDRRRSSKSGSGIRQAEPSDSGHVPAKRPAGVIVRVQDRQSAK